MPDLEVRELGVGEVVQSDLLGLADQVLELLPGTGGAVGEVPADLRLDGRPVLAPGDPLVDVLLAQRVRVRGGLLAQPAQVVLGLRLLGRALELPRGALFGLLPGRRGSRPAAVNSSVSTVT